MMSGGRGTSNFLPRREDEAPLTPSPACGGGSGWGQSLPTSAVLRVVQLDAHFEELLPNLIRAGKVPPIPGRLPLGDQLFDFGIDYLGELDDIEDAVRMPQHGHRTCALLGRRLSRLEPCVEGLDEFEEMTDGRRQIEVVIESFVPADANLRGGLSVCHNAPEPHRELIEALDGTVRGRDQLAGN